MTNDKVKQACRRYIDSIKNEPWYQAEYDDIILEAFEEGAAWYKQQQTEQQNNDKES